jgi:hypothetical protein
MKDITTFQDDSDPHVTDSAEENLKEGALGSKAEAARH